MIKIIHPNTETDTILDYYRNSKVSFSFTHGSPHTLEINDQIFQLNFNDTEYQQYLTSSHPLLSAIGKKPCSVLDAFAGLGKDAFILAHQNFTVTSSEINPVLYLLLSQAVENYPLDNWQVIFTNACELFQKDRFDIVYLDPMFTEKRKSKPKLSMQVIQQLVLDTPFNHWQQAYDCAKKRLVIKHHQRTPTIRTLPKPSLQISGKRNVRYDVYLKA